ncbi:hypothetical protein C8J56DRAFT_915551 [Mycena floridula]|nr:hypothetical protein C8J56DRAFT_915551 [Mycena floridula]
MSTSQSDAINAAVKANLLRTGRFIMKGALPLIFDSMFWMLYSASALITVCVLCRRGLDRTRTYFLACITVMFTLDTIGFAQRLFAFFYQNRQILLRGGFSGAPLTAVTDVLAKTDATISTVWMLLLIVGDSIVIWRAWSLWIGRRWIMIVPIILFIASVVNVPFLAKCTFKNQAALLAGSVAAKCKTTNIIGWVSSLAANASATCIIAYITWCYYISQIPVYDRARSQKLSKVLKVLIFLVESGFAYLAVMVCSVTLALVQGQEPTYGPGIIASEIISAIVNHLIGITPTAIILLVSLDRSPLDDYHYSQTQTVSQTPIQFALDREEPSETVVGKKLESSVSKDEIQV